MGVQGGFLGRDGVSGKAAVAKPAIRAAYAGKL